MCLFTLLGHWMPRRGGGVGTFWCALVCAVCKVELRKVIELLFFRLPSGTQNFRKFDGSLRYRFFFFFLWSPSLSPRFGCCQPMVTQCQVSDGGSLSDGG